VSWCASALAFALAFALPAIVSPSKSAAQPPPDSASAPAGPVIVEGLDPDGRLRLAVGRSRALICATRLRSAEHDGAAIAQGTADVASAIPVTPNSIMVTARKAGSTNLIIEDDLGRRQLVEVIVGVDLYVLQEQLKSLSPDASIDATDDNGSLVLRGHVPSLKIADQAAQIAGAYYSGKVVNLLEVSGGQQVMLQVKFAEVSRSVATNLGVNFGETDGKTYFANNVGNINPFSLSSASLFAADPLSAAGPGSAVQLFGNAAFGRSAFDYFISCLRTNQLMRTLAEPDLTAISGEQASFQVGGQIPIPVPQQSAGGGTGGAVITIQYENYGILLHFTPVVLGDGRIRLKIDPEVSDLDYAHGVTIGGFVVPGFTTRTVDTTVELADGQTFSIAGLLNNQVSATTNSIPGLGDLPVLGALFRSVQYQRNQTELVVMVTPRLVEAVNPDQVPTAPGENWRYPNEADLFIARDLGGPLPDGVTPPPPVKAAGPPPRFQGSYGFAPTDDTLVVER
jgi:pilus assembly protein CpaC